MISPESNDRFSVKQCCGSASRHIVILHVGTIPWIMWAMQHLDPGSLGWMSGNSTGIHVSSLFNSSNEPSGNLPAFKPDLCSDASWAIACKHNSHIVAGSNNKGSKRYVAWWGIVFGIGNLLFFCAKTWLEIQKYRFLSLLLEHPACRNSADILFRNCCWMSGVVSYFQVVFLGLGIVFSGPKLYAPSKYEHECTPFSLSLIDSMMNPSWTGTNQQTNNWTEFLHSVAKH